MDEDGEIAPNQSSSSTVSASLGMHDRTRQSRTEHPEDIEREHEKPSTAEVTKRKAEDDEDEEAQHWDSQQDVRRVVFQ